MLRLLRLLCLLRRLILRLGVLLLTHKRIHRSRLRSCIPLLLHERLLRSRVRLTVGLIVIRLLWIIRLLRRLRVRLLILLIVVLLRNAVALCPVYRFIYAGLSCFYKRFAQVLKCVTQACACFFPRILHIV